MMKRLCVAAAVSAALASPAWAADFSLGLLNPSSTQVGVAFPNSEGKIKDNFSFSIASASTVQFDFFAYDFDTDNDPNTALPPGDVLSQVSFQVFDALDLFLANQLDYWTTSPDHTSKTNWTILGAGDYILYVEGDQPGVSSGYYDMTVSVPIPEPETYAMLLAGLGLLGVVARRRKQLQG